MKKNKLTLALLIGIIALSSIGAASTIAWYSMSSHLQVNQIEISINSERSLKISLTDDPSLAKEEYAFEELDQISVFYPVTSAYRDSWMKNKADKPSFYDDTINYPSESAPSLKEVTGGFYSQDFYLFSDDDVWVTINPEKTFMRANTEYNASYAKELYASIQHSSNPNDQALKGLSEEEIYERLNELVKAMRFSLLVLSEEKAYDYVIIDPYMVNETVYGGLLDNDIDRYYDYYHSKNDNNYYERVYGDINDRSLIVYDNELALDSNYLSPNEIPSAFNAKHKAGVKQFNYEKSSANGFEFKKEGAHKLDEFTNRINTPLNIPVYKDKANKIRLSIYIEGYDLDSVNYTMGASFLSGIEFVISREM